MAQEARTSTGTVLAMVGMIVTVALLVAWGAAGGIDAFIIAAACTGGVTIFGAIVRRHMQPNLQQQRLPAPAAPTLLPRARRRHRMPSPQSAASAPMQGLAGAEAALTNLLGELRDDNVDPSWIAYAWQVASNAASEMRAVAGKLELIEGAIAHTPATQRPTLHDGVVRLRKWLDDGLEAYQGMVAAASKMVLATTPASVASELTEAADRLAYVAQALSELSEQYSWLQAR